MYEVTDVYTKSCGTHARGRQAQVQAVRNVWHLGESLSCRRYMHPEHAG